MILFHYTCQYNADLIAEEGRILPRPQPALGGRSVVWLGDFRQRTTTTRERLGLDMHAGSNRPCASRDPECDPIAVRFGVVVEVADHPYVHPYTRLGKEFPAVAAMYRALPGAMPWRWWYSIAPIKIIGGSHSNV